MLSAAGVMQLNLEMKQVQFSNMKMLSSTPAKSVKNLLGNKQTQLSVQVSINRIENGMGAQNH